MQSSETRQEFTVTENGATTAVDRKKFMGKARKAGFPNFDPDRDSFFVGSYHDVDGFKVELKGSVQEIPIEVLAAGQGSTGAPQPAASA